MKVNEKMSTLTGLLQTPIPE